MGVAKGDSQDQVTKKISKFLADRVSKLKARGKEIDQMEVIEEEIEPIISELVSTSEVNTIEQSKSETSQLEKVSSLVQTVHAHRFCEECKSDNPIQGPLFQQLYPEEGQVPLLYCLNHVFLSPLAQTQGLLMLLSPECSVPEPRRQPEELPRQPDEPEVEIILAQQMIELKPEPLKAQVMKTEPLSYVIEARPGQTVNKKWWFKNTGQTAWPVRDNLRFAVTDSSHDLMIPQGELIIDKEILPNEICPIEVQLNAPQEEGIYPISF